MLRALACPALALLALAPLAHADGPQADPGVMQGWAGVTAPGVPFRYVTFAAGRQTFVVKVRRSSGRVRGFRLLTGTWGIPIVANDGTTGGLSHDRKLLVLAGWTQTPSALARIRSKLLVVGVKSLRVWRRVSLAGDFTFDALSPGGQTLFLIEHLVGRDRTRYRVRAYDLAARRLLPTAITDRSEAGSVMRGYPVTRAASPDGRWAYTLYQQPGRYPFVHALDTVARSAHCIDIPWQGSEDTLYSTRMRLRRGTLTLTTYDGSPLFRVDTATFSVKHARPKRVPLGLGAPAHRASVTGRSIDHGKSIQSSVRRQTYSLSTTERGFS